MLEEALKTEVPASQRSEEERALTVKALEARGLLRLGKKYACILDKRGPLKADLNEEQMSLAKEFQDGSLRIAANKATMKSGNGRLRARDGTWVDIGGNAAHSLSGHYLDNYIPPNWQERDWD